MMEYRLHRDGSYDIICGSFALEGAYPALDGRPIRPIAVTPLADGARYALPEGSLALRMEKCGRGLRLDCRVEGLWGAHDLSPLAGAAYRGFAQAFRQGFGIGGPSGIVDLSREKEFESYGLAALGEPGRCLTLCARDQRRFTNRYRLREGLFEAAFLLEGACAEGDLPAIYIEEGADFSSALAHCAGEIAREMGARGARKPAFHWCSWYYLYHNLDMPTLREYLAGFAPLKEEAPFTHIQIDAGYFPSCGDWLLPNERFPNGLKEAAEVIRAAGYAPGVWVGPFMVGDNSTLYKQHPDWMLKDNEGNNVRPWIQYNEPKPWGYRDSDYFVLDTSHPEAMAYIRQVFRTLKEWGYTLYKTDFLLWGWQDSGKVRRYAPGKTSVEYFRDFMAAVREEIGEDSAWLGCIAPFLPSLGYVDMMRIGGDVGAQWEEGGFGPVNMIRETVADHYFNNVYWQNDPDAVLLRDFHIHLEGPQVEALAILQAITGGVVTTSDPIHLIAPERRALLRLIRPDQGVVPSYPYWQEGRPEVVLTAPARRGQLVYFFNPTPKEIVSPCDWEKMLGAQPPYLYRRGAGPCAAENFVRVPARGGALFYASDAPIAEEPDNLWKW